LVTGIEKQSADHAIRQRGPVDGLTDPGANDYQIMPEIVT
jgi:hypothetical protein